MGRPLRIDWRDDAATLRALYQQEREGPLRSRLHALWLLRQGRGLGETATVVGVAYRTLQQWLAWYRADGLAEVRAHRKAGHGRPARLTEEQQARLLAQTATGACFSVHDIIAWVRQEFAVSYTPSGMYDRLRRQRVRPKVPRPFNPQSSPEAQAAWKKGGLGWRSSRRA